MQVLMNFLFGLATNDFYNIAYCSFELSAFASHSHALNSLVGDNGSTYCSQALYSDWQKVELK